METAFKRTVYLFAAPALILYVVFWILPIFATLYFSFTNTTGFLNNYKFVGLDNYRNVITDGSLLNAIKNTVIYVVVSLSVGNAAALILALVLNANLKLKGLYRSIFYIPTLFSTVVVGFIWGYVYMPYYGLISTVLKFVGFQNIEPNLLGNFSTALFAVILVDIWKSIGGVMIIYLAGLQTIPSDVLESGVIDGCTGIQMIRYIKIPLLAPSITVNITLGMIGSLKAFDYVYVMTQGGPGNSTETLMHAVFKMAFNSYMYGKGSALGVLSFIVILAFTMGAVGFLRSREVEA